MDLLEKLRSSVKYIGLDDLKDYIRVHKKDGLDDEAIFNSIMELDVFQKEVEESRKRGRELTDPHPDLEEMFPDDPIL